MSASTSPRLTSALALALMVSSGCAALGYQIVWTQQISLWLGHESAAVLAVVAAFFGGLGVGAWLFGARSHQSRAPGRWFAACEAVIGVWSLVLVWLLTPLSRGLLGVIGAEPTPAWHWLVAFGATFVLLLPATAAMGATLPAMERALERLRAGGTSVAVLYAANTAGAVLGVLTAAFVLVPAFGLAATSAVCAALNVVAAAAALLVFRSNVDGTAPARAASAPSELALLGVTGLLGIGYEVLVVRVLSQVAENTVYTFALLLAVYLVGTTGGAAIYARAFVGRQRPPDLRDRLLRAVAATCLLGMLGLAAAEPIRATTFAALGGSMRAALAAEVGLAAIGFLLPAVAMGMLFSHLATNATAAGVGFGRALACNTLGAAAAPWLFGVVLLPALGSKLALWLVAAGYLALSSPRAWRSAAQWTLVVLAAVLLAAAPPPGYVAVPRGGRLVSLDEGRLATVSIVEDASGVTRLHINNRQQEGSNATVLADSRQALLPLLLHAAPRRALFLGLGTGVTASAATADRALRVDVVELLPEVVAASAYFIDSVGFTPPPERFRVIAADARRFVRAASGRYDVIVADNFHPARSGSGALYTVEHFRAIRDRLEAGGLFCQWLPLHQLDLDTLRSIARSFLAVYPGGTALLATNGLDTPVLGLVARESAAPFELEALRARLDASQWARSPAEFGLADEFAVLGSFVAGSRSLARFASAAPLNTDDRPVVAYRAPRVAYESSSAPRDRLVELLREVAIEPRELLAASEPEVGSRLEAYWTARDRFIEIGRGVRITNDLTSMLSQVREPLLAVLRTSPDFRPAYDPLLRMAIELADIDSASARRLLIDLERAQPARAEAAQALREIKRSE